MLQGYGRKAQHSASWVYPGSGATCDTAQAAAAGGSDEDDAAEAVAVAATRGGEGDDDIDADSMPMSDSHVHADAPAGVPEDPHQVRNLGAIFSGICWLMICARWRSGRHAPGTQPIRFDLFIQECGMCIL